MLSDKEWITLSEIVEILEPFEEITTVLSGQNYVTLSLVYPFIKKLTEILKEGLKDVDDSTVDENDIETVELFDLSNDNENDIDFNESNGIIEVVIYETSKCRGQKAKININQSVEIKNITNLLKESLLYWISFYWSTPSSIGLITTLLDSRFKDLRNFESCEKNEVLKNLYDQYEWLNIQEVSEPEPPSSTSRKRTRSIMDSLFSSSGVHSTNMKKDELTKYRCQSKLCEHFLSELIRS